MLTTTSVLIVIKKYGLLTVFVGTFFEGEGVLITAAVLAGEGVLSPFGVWLTALLGAWTGHLFWFSIGRTLGTRYILKRFHRYRSHFEEVNRIVLRHPKTSIFILQYLYGMRIIGALGLGLTELPLGLFLIFETVNCAFWALVIFTVGYIMGETFMHILHGWLRWLWLSLSLLVIMLLYHRLQSLLHSRIKELTGKPHDEAK